MIAGQGRAVLDGQDHPMVPGTTIFLGRNRLHMFVNDGAADLTFAWLIPAQRAGGFLPRHRRRCARRTRSHPFPRPADVLAIEARTVFAPPPPDGGRTP